MISEIPSSEDFRAAGVGYLNLAWDSAIELALDHRMQEEYAGEVEKESTEGYWEAAQRPLAAAVALAVQGAEFLIKAKIADVSPYLLIAGSEFPAAKDGPIKFSQLRTPDASDLVRIHDAVASSAIPSEFIPILNDLRGKRNIVFHSVDKSMRFTERDVLRAVLQISEVLSGSKSWLPARREYLYKSPILELGGLDPDEYAIPCLAREFLYADEFLGPSERERFLGLTKARRYACSYCYRANPNDEIGHNFAQLLPNNPAATQIHCLICDSKRDVRRVSCLRGCPGNVVDNEYDDCLTCINPKA